MSEITLPSVQAILDQTLDPETGRAMGPLGQIQDVQVDDNKISYSLGITSCMWAIGDEVRDGINDRLTAAFPGAAINATIVPHERPPARIGQLGLRVKKVVLVGSGKGGVGKSTVAASLAVMLNQMGSRVGLMDADVYGPSVPHLLGLKGRPEVDADKKIRPIELREGFPVMSMGFLVEPDQAVIWRGPMLHGSIQQFLRDTQWGELDYLIIDMPPGTGDIALTLSQSVPISGAVVVCTPQEVALLDAVKAINMFRKVNIPVAGMVENMSGFLCPDNGKTYDIFGRGGARDKAAQMDVPFLGGLPIDIRLREAGDEGRLHEVIADQPDAAAPIEQAARALVRHLASKAASEGVSTSLPTL
ncbi:Mrp/NBP35 family ATP-binding protein [Crateriforma conspicua]|uniref:Iron-sulfur cluster carrier protein n=1 Tax=Crateriforma conspicua TaxID=2527996 RepID=A0A5C5XTM6_9PLAN|nr:Mrp/NBP35 family ATP-binding protein [Crateriforma conspicua]TWT65713.1 antiporter inner membrane protein [Crateriforma conspicua]